MLQSMLTAPQALFVVEQGTEMVPGGTTKLGRYEIAAALAYTLTDHPRTRSCGRPLRATS